MCVVLANALGAAATCEPQTLPASPIRIEHCVVLSRLLLRDPLHGLSANLASGLSIRFENVSPVTATLVRINVRYQGSSDTIVVKGVFASGVAIDRTYQTFAGEQAGSDAACSITDAAFEDGTAWSPKR